MISNPSPKLLQWNSRGLTRAKLEEFRYHLNCLNPLFVFLSETHWYDSTNISFRAFNLSKRNRPDGQKSGVALLLSKRFSFVPISFPNLSTIEAVGATVVFNGKRIDLISVYCPRGNADIVEIRALFNCITNEAIIGGDFNAHHPLWGRSSQPNKAGRSLFKYLNDSNLLLCTPPKLETRIAPGSAAPSNLDLTFASLACDLSISLGSDWDSDHIPLLIYFDSVFSPTDPGPPSKWVFRDRSWPLWNASIESSLQSSQFFSLNDPELANSNFNQAIISAKISASLRILLACQLFSSLS